MKEHLQMTSFCVYLWILRSFSEQLFYKAPLRNFFFHVQVAEFQAADLDSEKLFRMCFSSILFKNE